MITITIYKNYKLVITPTDWFIWPVWKRDWNQTFKTKQIEIAFKWTDNTEKNYGTHYATYRAQTDFYIWVLFFRVHFPSWWTSEEVASIYPANYNWKDDPDYDEKYQRLADTGYFA